MSRRKRREVLKSYRENRSRESSMRSFDSTLNNRYHLDKLIGEGGFANVYLATDLELGRQVAIKVLEANWVKDKELLTRFRLRAIPRGSWLDTSMQSLPRSALSPG